MPYYSAYGLGIHSDIELPELVAVPDAEGEIVILAQPIDAERLKSAADSGGQCIRPNSVCLMWEGFGAIQIDNGRAITVDFFPGVDEADLRLPLLGLAMATLLHQRGMLVLHASAIEISGSGAVAFLGDKGEGKSTIAAHLHQQGHALLADDVVAIDTRHPHDAYVIPGTPYVKLWPDAVTALGEDPEQLPRLGSDYDKRGRPIRQRFANNPVPLRHVVVLERGETTVLEQLEAHDALPHVIRHSFATRYGNSLLEGRLSTAHLRDCCTVLSGATAWRFTRERNLSGVRETSESLVAQLTRRGERDVASVNAAPITRQVVSVGSV